MLKLQVKEESRLGFNHFKIPDMQYDDALLLSRLIQIKPGANDTNCQYLSEEVVKTPEIPMTHYAWRAP